MKDHCGREVGPGPRGKKLLLDLFWIALAFGMLAICIVMLSSSSHAQELPQAPHRFLDKTNIALFTGVATMRALDLHSTWKLRRNGWNEYVLPARLVDSKPAFTAFSVGMVAAHVGGCYLLHRTGHHRMERIASAVHIATGAAAAANNYWWVHQ
jgi:hypothetical protein